MEYGLYRYHRHCRTNPQVDVDSCSACANASDCRGRPSFRQLSEVEMRDAVRHGCNGWASDMDAMRWPRALVVGGVTLDSTGPLTHAYAHPSMIRCVRSRKKQFKTMRD